MELRVWEKEVDEQIIKIFMVPVLKDNYCYIVSWGKEALVIDPGEAAPVLKVLQDNELNLKTILNTHHHNDHIAGNEEIKQALQVRVIGPSDVHIESVDQVVSDGEEIIIGLEAGIYSLKGIENVIKPITAHLLLLSYAKN